MTYIDRHFRSREYPYEGEFYTEGRYPSGSDGDLFADASGETVRTVLRRCRCDITETNGAFSAGASIASYDVYFGIGDDEAIGLSRGSKFHGMMGDVSVDGIVISIGRSELDGVHCLVRCSDI